MDTEKLINQILDQVIQQGPKQKDQLVDKYVDLNKIGIFGEQNETVIKSNRIISAISTIVTDKKYAQYMYENCMLNETVYAVVMRYVASIILQPYATYDFDVELNTTVAKKVFPEIRSYDNIIMEENNRRLIFLKKFGFSVPSREALEAISKFVGTDKVLEIGAGIGFWAYLMNLYHINVIATDIGKTGQCYDNFNETWMKLEMIDHKKAMEKYNKECNVLFMSWPIDKNNSGAESLRMYLGKKVIYIGECQGGITATDTFFEILRRKYVLKNIVDIPNWIGKHDKLYFYENNS